MVGENDFDLQKTEMIWIMGLTRNKYSFCKASFFLGIRQLHIFLLAHMAYIMAVYRSTQGPYINIH